MLTRVFTKPQPHYQHHALFSLLEFLLTIPQAKYQAKHVERPTPNPGTRPQRKTTLRAITLDCTCKTLLIPIASFLTVSSTFHLLFKVLFIFRSRYLFAIGLAPVFSFRWNLPPTLGCIPKQPDSKIAKYVQQRICSWHNTGLSPSLALHSKRLYQECCQIYNPKTTIQPPKWWQIFNLSFSHFTRSYYGYPS